MREKKMKSASIARLLIAGIIFMASLNLSGQIRFEDVTQKAGLIEPLKGMMGHCAAWGDVNGDGYPDLFVGTFSDRPDSIYNLRGHTGGPEPDKLFINQGNGTFKEVLNSPVRIIGRCSGAAFADFNNDGHLDLIVSHQSYDWDVHARANNFLFQNDGKGNFTDVTAQSGLNLGWPFLGRNTFVFDFDGDGLLDIFMQEDFVRAKYSGGNSRLMKNMGNMKFKDVTAEAGLPHGLRQGIYGLGGFVGDINGDGWPDMFFPHSCRMFINNKNGTFHEKVYNFVNEKYTEPATTNPDWTCGADIGDLNNDGRMDLVMGDHFSDSASHRLYVYLNMGNDAKGDPIFKDITMEANVANPDGRAPHIQIQDIDNDSRMDIFTSRCAYFVYRNMGVKDGIPRFEAPVKSGLKGGIGYWAGGPLADYDLDGKLDFLGPEWEPGLASPLLHNVTANASNYIDIRLELEHGLNRNGIGAKVEIFKAGLLDKKEGRLGTYIISVSNGYASGYEAVAHFGLPYDKTVDIRITMPCNGSTYIARSVKRNQIFVLKK